MHEFDVVAIEDETGGYVAFVPALPGCHIQGDTLGELMDNVKEAIELYARAQNKKIFEVAESLNEEEFLELCKAIFTGSKTSVEMIEEQRGERS